MWHMITDHSNRKARVTRRHFCLKTRPRAVCLTAFTWVDGMNEVPHVCIFNVALHRLQCQGFGTAVYSTLPSEAV
jgi:hypothetical protein